MTPTYFLRDWANVRIKVTVTKRFIGARLFLKSEAEKGLKTMIAWKPFSLKTLSVQQKTECLNPSSGKEDSRTDLATHTHNKHMRCPGAHP